MTADAASAGGLPKAGVTVTDTPVARETDYGRVDDHSSAIRAAGDARHTFNRVPDYPVPGADDGVRRVDRRPAHGIQFVVGFHRDAGRRPGNLTRRRDRRRLGDRVGVQRTAVRRRSVAAGGLRPPGDQRRHHHHAQRDRRRRPGPSHPDRDRHRQHHAAVRRGRQAPHRCAALRRNPVGTDHRGGTDDGSAGVQFGITDLSITQYDASGFAHPVNLRHTALVPGPPPGSAVARWDLGSELLGQAGLRQRPGEHAVRAVDGAGTGGAGQFQPHAERARRRCR